VAAACARLRTIAAGGHAGVVACDVGGLVADVVALEALARLQLTARRLGCRLRLRHASPDLQALVDLCGLADVLPREEGR
jgi:ABC-type transporter Mla MlaB component